MKTNRFVLGTVQFGLQYGINSTGHPNEEEVCRILRKAYDSGINTLDTSSAYGNSESVLGRAMRDEFQIVSKYPKCSQTVSECFAKTLKNLRRESLYGYLLHHFSIYETNPSIWDELVSLKCEGRVLKIGFSLYEPEELERVFEDGIEFDIVQVPYNVFDRKFERYFPMLRQSGVEIHVRSTFLQGLFFKDRDSLPDKLKPLRPYLEQLDVYSAANDISVAEAALNFNLQNPYIDGVLIGVDNVGQLQSNLSSVIAKRIDLNIKVKEEELLNPANWL